MEDTKCPACKNNNLKTILFPERNFFDCSNCRLQWGDGVKRFQGETKSKITSYYLSAKSIQHPASYLPYLEFFEELKRWKSGTGLKILDVGCGNGIFIKECLRRGFSAVGVEASPRFLGIIPAELKDKIFFGTIEEYLEPSKDTFDVITLWDVFHCLEKPFVILDGLRKVLRRDGIVYLRVNNREDVYNFAVDFSLKWFLLLGKRLFVGCFGEYSYWNFSSMSMTSLLAENGWKILSFQFSDTPASRLTPNPFLAAFFNIAYGFNRMQKWGKVGNYYVADKKGSLAS